MSYQRVVAGRFGGPDVLEVVDQAELPQPGRGEVRVKILAAGTGFTDTLLRRGLYPYLKDKPPFTPGYDIVGLVDALGEGVEGLQVGQKVADMPIWGGYSQYLVRPATSVVPIPDELDPAEAVCLPLAFVTAYQMLVRYRSFKQGDRVFIQGASGTVGTALLALGKHFGLRMWGTASKRKFAVLERFGCIPIDYHNEPVEARLKIEVKEGLDGVFDAMGGGAWRYGYRCLGRGGLLCGYGSQTLMQSQASRLAMAGSLGRDLGFLLLRCNLPGNGGRKGVFYDVGRRRISKPAEYARDLRDLADLLQLRAIVPEVDSRRPLSDAAMVHRTIDAGGPIGKIVLMPFGQASSKSA